MCPDIKSDFPSLKASFPPVSMPMALFSVVVVNCKERISLRDRYFSNIGRAVVPGKLRRREGLGYREGKRFFPIPRASSSRLSRCPSPGALYYNTGSYNGVLL